MGYSPNTGLCMNDKASESVTTLSCEERYDYFLTEVGEGREIWVLVNAEQHFLKIYAEEYQLEYVPVWPNAGLASEYGDGAALRPLGISLPEFFKKWVPGLKRDGLEVGVIPGKDGTLWITEVEELVKDLQDELSAF